MGNNLTILKWRCDEAQFLDAIEGARLSYRSGDAMDSYLSVAGGTDRRFVTIGQNDARFVRARITSPLGGEDKLLQTIHVSAFVRAPLRFMHQLQTYRIAPPFGDGTADVAAMATIQSSSLMHHTRKRGALTADDFTDTTDPALIGLANDWYAAWIASGEPAGGDSECWERFQDAIGRGYLYTVHWDTNYAILRNVYAQRATHRQGEWRALCDWIEQLPHAWTITTPRRSPYAAA